MGGKAKGKATDGAKAAGGGATVGVIVATLVAAAGGSYVGMLLSPPAPKDGGAEAQASDATPAAYDKSHGDDHGKPATHATAAAALPELFSGGATLTPLPQIITNLAGSGDAWLRLEASVLVPPAAADAPDDGEPSADLPQQIAQDLMAYLRTVTVAQIQGASGFYHLREDLNDRIRVRTNGAVKELIIHTMVLE